MTDCRSAMIHCHWVTKDYCSAMEDCRSVVMGCYWVGQDCHWVWEGWVTRVAVNCWVVLESAAYQPTCSPPAKGLSPDIE